jgi:cytoskeleton protein RodZ
VTDEELPASAESVTEGDAPEANVTVLPVLTPPGGRLRAAREAKGLGLGQVVEALRVEQRLVEAMESNRFDVFDAPVYARGFLRKYAQYLGLSPEDMIAELDGLSRGPVQPTHVPMTTAAPKFRDWARINSTLGIIAAIVIVVGSFWWWHGHGARPEAAPSSAPVTPVAPPAPASTVAPSPSAAAAPVNERGESGGEAAVPASLPAAGEEPGTPVAPAEQALTAPSPSAAGVQSPPPSEHVLAHLELEFRGDSWAEVYGGDGSRKVYGLLKAGERRTLSGTGPWRIVLGSTDQVRVTLDGREIVPGPEQRKGNTSYFRVDARGKLN